MVKRKNADLWGDGLDFSDLLKGINPLVPAQEMSSIDGLGDFGSPLDFGDIFGQNTVRKEIHNPQQNSGNGAQFQEEVDFAAQKDLANRFVRGQVGREEGYPPDAGLLPYLKRINANPDVATYSSCSGLPDPATGNHPGGHPYFWIVFRTEKARRFYEGRLKSAGFHVFNIEGTGTYVEVDGSKNTSPASAKRFLERATQILSG